MTPDANPLLGPLPGVRGFWVAAGLSLNGFGGGGGIGRAMAGWITAGDPGVDVGPYRAWRFSDTYRDPGFAAGLARETYSRLLPAALPVRRGRGRAAAPAVGAPRPAPGGRRRVRHEGRLGAGRLSRPGAAAGVAPGATRPATAGRRPPWFERVCAEARAVRERAGIVDLSLVRQDRGRGAGRARSPPARQRERHRPTGRQRRLHAVVRRARRDGGRRHRHAARGRPVPGRDRRRLPRVRDGLASGARRRRRRRRRRSATSAAS